MSTTSTITSFARRCTVCLELRAGFEFGSSGGRPFGHCNPCRRKAEALGITLRQLRGGSTLATVEQEQARRDANAPEGPCLCGCIFDEHGKDGCAGCGVCPAYFEAGL